MKSFSRVGNDAQRDEPPFLPTQWVWRSYARTFNDGQWMLPVDLIETQEALKLGATLPGVDPKDVDIEINDNLLTLTAERPHEGKLDEGGYHQIEQQYGTFSRSITLPVRSIRSVSRLATKTEFLN